MGKGIAFTNVLIAYISLLTTYISRVTIYFRNAKFMVMLSKLKKPKLLFLMLGKEVSAEAMKDKPAAYCFSSFLRISTRRILPLMVLGSSSTNSMTRGYL